MNIRGTLKIDRNKESLIMDRTFAKFSEDTTSNEYQHLQAIRKDYPDYTVKLRQIKKNTDKKTYPGLTYEYIKNYIIKVSDPKDKNNALAEFEKQIDISNCYSKGKRYPLIKKWFFETYPEIKINGMPDVTPEDKENNIIEITAESKDLENAG